MGYTGYTGNIYGLLYHRSSKNNAKIILTAFFFKQKTAYEISECDWSSDVCSSESRIAIYLLSVVLILFGVFHFVYPRDLMVYVPTSLAGGILWAYIVGTAFILAGLSFMTNQFVKFTGYLLAALLIYFILSIHLPNYLHAGSMEMKQLALINILKDTAITGFSLHIAAGAHHQHLDRKSVV